MAKLPNRVKAFIVECVACYDAPATVGAAVNAEFGLSITRQQVEAHDPTKVAGQYLGKKWKELFHAKRAEFLAGMDRIGIAHKVTRMRKLDRAVEHAERVQNWPLAASLMEQAAKEMGDVFTNRRATEMTGKDGGPVEGNVTFNFSQLSDADLATLRAELNRPDEEDEA